MSESLRIVITGGSSGIGAALVEALAADGHSLFVCARREDRLAAVTCQGRLVAGHPCDVTNEQQVAQFVAWIKEQTRHLDGLINCAGILGPIGPFAGTDSSEWLETLRVNLFGTYLMIKHALPLLNGSAAPRIINFSGGGAFNPFPNYSAYACSKAGVIRLTECLAVELAPRGIRVNAVAPGFVATPIHQATLDAGPEKAGEEQFAVTLRGLEEKRPPQPMIECVRFLLSSESDALSGKTISANFDPWRRPEFLAHIEKISESDVFTMRRVMWAPGLPSSLAELLEKADRARPSLLNRKPSVAPRRTSDVFKRKDVEP